jgi:hypothetical protein
MEYLTIVTHVTAYLLSTLHGVKRKPPKLPAPILLEGIDNCTAGGRGQTSAAEKIEKNLG